MKYLLFLFIYISSLYSLDFKVATYNVENFFDLHYAKTEYRDYVPYTRYWNRKSYNKKLQNTNRVISDLNADILALQEIESRKVLDAIINKNPKYKFSAFHKNKNSAIGLAILSKYKITSHSIIKVGKYDKYSRDILKATLLIDNKPLIVYINHWRSKRAKESKRIVYAMELKKEVDKLSNQDYIILGDLNSNYNEYQTFKYDKKLNDTYNITGINQILNTTNENNFIQKHNIFDFKGKVHYNTWLELKKQNRFSTKFKKEHNSPDNILLSSTLFDTKNISYINKSFNVFRPKYLFNKGRIFRWNKFKQNGYSDHLPVYAFFSTKIQDYNLKDKKLVSKKQNSISYLYEIENISNYELKNVTVIYKSDKVAIIKKNNADKAIMLYKPPKNLKVGFSYNFVVREIDQFNGLKEIKKISHIVEKSKNKNFKNLYLDATKIDLHDRKFLNNIVNNIKGIYKKKYLYFNNKKIRLYFAKNVKKPKEGDKISLSFGHLSIYKSSIQIVLHREKDFIVY